MSNNEYGTGKSLSPEAIDKKAREPEKREIVLLKAVYKLLSKQERSSYVLDMLSTMVTYDGAQCDGACLLDDIRDFLEDL
jgi:hypothetical protein